MTSLEEENPDVNKDNELNLTLTCYLCSVCLLKYIKYDDILVPRSPRRIGGRFGQAFAALLASTSLFSALYPPSPPSLVAPFLYPSPSCLFPTSFSFPTSYASPASYFFPLPTFVPC